VVAEASSRLESRFVLNALVPTLVFLPICIGTVGQAIWGIPQILDWYLGLAPALVVLLPLALLAVAWLIASVVASQWDRLVTVYEGYPLVWLYEHLVQVPIVGAAADKIYVPGKLAHQERQARMAQKAARGPAEEFDLHLAYTEDPDDVLPTRLGNVLRSAEMYPLYRYGIDIAVLWTRLAMLLPDQLQRDIERSVIQYQLPLVISAWSLMLAACSLILAWAGQAIPFMWTFIPSSLVGIGGYYLALRPAEHYGIALRSVFDDYRGELHAKWADVLSSTVEKHDFETLRTFIVTGKLDHRNVVGVLPSAGVPRDRRPARPVETRSRTVRFRPLRTPRLGLCAVIAMVLVFLRAYVYLTTTEVDVLVARADARPFEPLRADIESRSLYDVGGRVAASPGDVHLSELVSLGHLNHGDILTQDDYLEVDADLDVLLPVDAAASVPLRLKAGDDVTLVFGGDADFASDSDCRRHTSRGVPRVVQGKVLVPADGSGTMVVATSDDGVLPVRCFETADVSVVVAEKPLSADR
jgi:hypothetical protein